MDLRFFISSTTVDLAEYRAAVAAVVHTFGWQLWAMDKQPGDPSYAIDRCLEEVKASNVLIAIVGHRYGDIPAGESRSYTHCEVEQARMLGIPVLCFMADNLFPRTHDGDFKDKQSAFRDSFRSFNNHFSYCAEQDKVEFKELVRTQLNKFTIWLSQEFDRSLRSSCIGVRRLLSSQIRSELAIAEELGSSELSKIFQLDHVPKPALKRCFEDIAGDSEFAENAPYSQAPHAGQLPESLSDRCLGSTSLETAGRMIGWLARLPNRMEDDTSKLAEFLAKLAMEVTVRQKAAILDWGTRQQLFTAHGPSSIQSLQARPPVRRLRRESSRVVILLNPSHFENKPELSDNSDLNLTAVVCDREGKNVQGLGLEKSSLTNENRIQILGDLVQEIAKTGIGTDVTREFLVPRNLIFAPIDQWKFIPSQDEEFLGVRTLGDDFPLIVRFLDRVIAQEKPGSIIKSSFDTRWGHLRTIWEKECAVCPIDRIENLNNPVAVYLSAESTAAWIRGMKSEQQVACLIALRPSGADSTEELEAVKATLLSGIPFVIWLRTSAFGPRDYVAQQQAIIDELKKIMSGQLLDKFNHRVFSHRCHPDNRLTAPHVTAIADHPELPVPALKDILHPLLSPA